jgi:hypothetical protein
MKKIRINLVLIVLFLFIGCSEKKEYTEFKTKIEDKSNIKYINNDVQSNSFSYGIANELGEIETDNIYYLEQGQTFKRFINIGNFISTDMAYKILMFDNYKQIDFMIEEKKFSNYDVFIKEGEDLQVPFEISDLEEGYHDILIAIFINTEKKLEKEERIETEFQNMIYLRLNIYIGNETIPEYKYADLGTQTLGANINISLHEDKIKNNIQFPYAIVNKDEKLNYFLSVGNLESQKEEFIVIILQDWKQELDSIKVFKLPSDTTVTIPMEAIFSDVGIHEITAIKIVNPYQKLNSQIETVTSSIRLGVDVK